MKTVLFVCYHNAGRSQMAEAFFNHIADERHLPFGAISAGTVASREVNPVVVEAMQAVGISMAGQLPKQLMQWHMDAADEVITMHCGVDPENCPTRVANAEDWGLDDPAGQSLAMVCEIRDEIAKKVGMLIARLEAADQTQ